MSEFVSSWVDNMDNTNTITIDTWHSPASEYPRAQVGSARIVTMRYPKGIYDAYQTKNRDYYIAEKRINITGLKINGKTWMVDDPPHWWGMQDHAAEYEGHVLCAGLGLGLIVHALNENPKVTKITVVERSQDVIDLVGPQVPHDKLEIINGDWYEQGKDTIPDVDGVLFDLFVGDARDFIGEAIEVACEIIRRWDDPVVRVHGLMNPWTGDVARAMKSKHRRIQIERMRERDGDNCWICNGPIDFSLPRVHDEAASIDHVHPFADGGSNHITNLRLAHRCCNENRGNPRTR